MTRIMFALGMLSLGSYIVSWIFGGPMGPLAYFVTCVVLLIVVIGIDFIMWGDDYDRDE